MDMDRRQFLRTAGLGTLAVAGASALGGTLAGCGGGSSSNGKMTLDFPTWQGDEPGVKVWWRKAIAAFEKKHQNVKINLQTVP